MQIMLEEEFLTTYANLRALQNSEIDFIDLTIYRNVLQESTKDIIKCRESQVCDGLSSQKTLMSIRPQYAGLVLKFKWAI